MFKMPEELEAFRLKVRKFVREEVRPLEEKLGPEAIGLAPDDLHALQNKAKEQNLWMPGVPKKYGGQELSVFALTLMAEEAAQHHLGAYSQALGAFGAEPPNILYEANDEQKEKYLYPALNAGKKAFMAISEPSGGSDPARSIQTRAVLDGDKWILNGTKLWISYVDKADFGIVFARTDEGREGISAFIVNKDMPGFSWKHVPVIRAWAPTEIYLDNCIVPLNNQLGERGQGFRLANKWLVRNRIPYTAGCIGIAQAAWEMAIEYANNHTVNGVPLIKKQEVQWSLADSEMDIKSARWLNWEAAWKADLGENPRREASMAKVYGTEVANRVIDRCIQIIGQHALTDEGLPYGRWFRELRIKRIGEGPSEVHRMVMSRNYVLQK
jgi:acyl-CoA dehydrogenase